MPSFVTVTTIYDCDPLRWSHALSVITNAKIQMHFNFIKGGFLLFHFSFHQFTLAVALSLSRSFDGKSARSVSWTLQRQFFHSKWMCVECIYCFIAQYDRMYFPTYQNKQNTNSIGNVYFHNPLTFLILWNIFEFKLHLLWKKTTLVLKWTNNKCLKFRKIDALCISFTVKWINTRNFWCSIYKIPEGIGLKYSMLRACTIRNRNMFT